MVCAALTLEVVKDFPEAFTGDVGLDGLLYNAFGFQWGALLVVVAGGALVGCVLSRAVSVVLVILYATFVVFCVLFGTGVLGN